MPSLIFIAACEKVVADDSGAPSLISVFAALDIQMPQTGSIPPRAVSDKPWNIFSYWRIEDMEIGKEFELHTQVLTPDGTEFGKSTDIMKFSARTHNIKTNVPGMPVGQEGDVTIFISASDKGGRNESEKFPYRVNIRHVKP